MAGISTGPAPAARSGGPAVGPGPRIPGGAPATMELGTCNWPPGRPPAGGGAIRAGGATGGTTGRGGATGGATCGGGAAHGGPVGGRPPAREADPPRGGLAVGP